MILDFLFAMKLLTRWTKFYLIVSCPPRVTVLNLKKNDCIQVNFPMELVDLLYILQRSV